MTLAVADEANRFGTLLRHWRTHRRLSQLDLSMVAEVSSRHLSFLETGRSRPSREMVAHLCEHLDVPLAQRNEMLHAAGFAPAYTSFDLGDPAMGAVRQAIDAVLDSHLPHPAVVVDRHWDLLTANAAAFALVAGVPAELMEPPVNVLRLSVHPDGLGGRIRNFPEYAGHVLDRLRRQVQRTGDPVLGELLVEIGDLVEAAGGVVHPIDATQVVLPMVLAADDADGGEVRFFSTISVFGAPHDVTLDELAIEAFHPADEATRRWCAAAQGATL